MDVFYFVAVFAIPIYALYCKDKVDMLLIDWEALFISYLIGFLVQHYFGFIIMVSIALYLYCKIEKPRTGHK